MNSNIKKVAELAGVSAMTVSRVINDSGTVAEDTRKRVLKAIEECHYYPNSIARGLVRNKMYIIGIVIYDSFRSRHNMFYEMINGIERIASKFNYNVMLFSYREGEDYRKRIVESGLVDGVIFMGINMNQEDIEYMDKTGFPYVVVGKRNMTNMEPYSIILDYKDAFQRATKKLIDKGYQEVGFVGMVYQFEPEFDKLLGYQQAFFEKNLMCNPQNIVCFEKKYQKQNEKHGWMEIEKLYQRGVRAFIMTDTARTRDILAFAFDRRMRIPLDIEFCIFDDKQMDVEDFIRLTSLTEWKDGYVLPRISMNQFDIGQKAMEFLVDIMEKGNILEKSRHFQLDVIF